MKTIALIPFYSITSILNDVSTEKECDNFVKDGHKNYTLENSIFNGIRLALKLYDREYYYNEVTELEDIYHINETPLHLLPYPINSKDFFDELTLKRLYYIGSIDYINSFLSFSLSKLRIKYCIKEYQELINSNTSIVNENNELFSLSPLLVNFKLWKYIIKYEFSLIPLVKRKFEVVKMISNLTELKKRIDNENVFNLGDFLFEELEDESPEVSIYFGQNKREIYTNPINNYITFLEKLKLNEISDTSGKNLIHQIEKINPQRKIKLLKPKKKAVAYLTCLLKKENNNYNEDNLNKISKVVVESIFENKKKEINSNLKFTNNALVDYIIFLAKEKYFSLYKKRSLLPKLVSSENLPLKIKGTSKSNMKDLFIERLRLAVIEENHEDFSKVKLTFDGLTSEIALKKSIRK
jgi:hypothetical protein